MLVVPFVAIEIPAEVAPDLAATTLRTCNMALGAGRCSIAAAGGPPNGTRWLAHVGVDTAQPTRFHIDLRDALFQNPTTTFSRALDFEPTDVPSHRWSTVGVVVAALVISAESDNYPENGSAAASANMPEEPPPSAAHEHHDEANSADSSAHADRRDASLAEAHPWTKVPERVGGSKGGQESREAKRALRIDAGGLLGTGAVSNATRYGVMLRPAIELTRDYSVWGQLSSSWDSGLISASGVSGALGLGVRTAIVPGWLSAEARLAGWLSRHQFEFADPAEGSDLAVRWRYGLGAGLDSWLVLSEQLGWFIGIDVVMAIPRVFIRVHGQEVGESPTIDATVASGVRLRLPMW